MPIRIDLDMENRRFKDIIFWNINEQHFTPEIFAKLVSEENSLTHNFEAEIASIIRNSVQHKLNSLHQVQGEHIRTLEIDVRIDNVCLRDNFEWDISNPDNSPEDFAVALANDLGLSAEFSTQISFQIRDQIAYYQKLLYDSKDMPYMEHGMTRFKKNRGAYNSGSKL